MAGSAQGDAPVRSESNRNQRKTILGWAFFALVLVSGVGTGQGPADEASKIQAMIDVLLSENTDMSLRQTQARALLGDRQAHGALIEILNKANQHTAKAIICRTIATYNGQFLPGDGGAEIPKTFTEPLLGVLRSDDAELSGWAGQALAKLANGVAGRLIEIVLDQSGAVQHRVSAIIALSRLPGKEPVLALGQLLDDEHSDIRQQAAAGLADMLGLAGQISAAQFTEHYQSRLAEMEDQTFLRRQLQLRQRQLLAARDNNAQLSKEIARWRQGYLGGLTEKFVQITDSNKRLEFLRPHLENQTEDALRIWAVDQINTWCRATNVQSNPAAGAMVELLKGFISDANLQVRILTAQAFERLVEKAPADIAAAMLSQLSQETDPRGQAAWLNALGTFKYNQTIEPALALLQSSDQQVVTEAARALGKISGVQENPPDAAQIKAIAESLAQTYGANSLLIETERELIKAMARIAGQEKFRGVARKHFDEILKGALSDPAPQVQAQAVEALTALRQGEVLGLLLNRPVNLLDNADTGVRHAVIAAIKQYGGKDHLRQLSDRLVQEDNIDVAKALRSAFTRILGSLPTKDTYDCLLNLKQSPQRDGLLSQAVLDLLLEKIGQDKGAGRSVPAEYEIEALLLKGEYAEETNQFEQAAQSYLKLIERTDVADEQKDGYRLKVLTWALADGADEGLLRQAPLLAQQMMSRPAGEQGLSVIGQACDRLVETGQERSLLQAAQTVADVVVPIDEQLSAAQKDTWRQRRCDLALKIIDQQLARLAGERQTEDGQAINLLSRLDERLKDYPTDAALEKRRAALEEFRTILQPAKAPEPTEPPEPTPPAAEPAINELAEDTAVTSEASDSIEADVPETGEQK